MPTEPIEQTAAAPTLPGAAAPAEHRTSDLRSLALRAGVLMALGFAPLLIQFGINRWRRPAYQFFPLA